MLSQSVVCPFEQGKLREVTGEILRPGGFRLTDRALEMRPLPFRAAVLDIGCSGGATVQRLIGLYRYRGLGIDISVQALQAGKRIDPDAPLMCADGGHLPFGNEIIDAVMVECSLSVMVDPISVLGEIYRVLTPGGSLVVSDVYARDLQGMESLRNLQRPCYLSGMQAQEEITALIQAHNFTILLWEDHSDELKKLTVRLILSGGLDGLYGHPAGPGDSHDKLADQQLRPLAALAKARPGYFLLVARK